MMPAQHCLLQGRAMHPSWLPRHGAQLQRTQQPCRNCRATLENDQHQQLHQPKQQQHKQQHSQNQDQQQHVISRRQLVAGLSITAAGVASAAMPAMAAIAPGPAVLPEGSVSSRQGSGFEERVSEFTLPNGLHFIVMERHTAPLVACHSYVNVGAFDEQDGATGLAHLLEHMAFKGTRSIGTRDYITEAPLLGELDDAFYGLQAAVATGASASEIARLQAGFAQLQATADALTVPNEYGSLLQQQGGVGLNATTSHDCTRYFVSLPSNKLELWFALEAERFQWPVFRQLYSEKQVVAEERRARIENSPMGAFNAAFASMALGNAYGRPVIGVAGDVEGFGGRDVRGFHQRYYHPSNTTISIVGDVRPEDVRRLAERYFGGWTAAAGAVTLPVGRQESAAEARPQGFGAGVSPVLEQPSPAGPGTFLAYYRPSMTSRQGIALEVATDVLSGGRSSRMVSELVLKQRALSASVTAAYPGEKHAGAALVYGIPRRGDTVRGVASLMQQQLDSLADSGPTDRELFRVKKAARTSLLGAVQSNSAMASALCSYHATTGSWRGILDELAIVDDLNVGEVRDVATAVFDVGNRFEGYMLPMPAKVEGATSKLQV